jgi:hypothetical protein
MHLLRVGADELGRIIWRPVLACAAMFAVVWGVRALWSGQGLLAAGIELSIVAVLGALSYVALVVMTWRAAGQPDGAETKLLELGWQSLRKVSTTIGGRR